MTKEGFWNHIESRSPKQFEKFKKWVDEYRVRTGWCELFREVHDLPDALQVGIFSQFITEIEPSYTLSLDFASMDSVKLGIKDWFEVEEAL